MIFQIDNQTIQELDIFAGHSKASSIFAFYNQTSTLGGQEKLLGMMSKPTSDVEILKSRQQKINFISVSGNFIDLHSKQLDFIEHYLRNRRSPLKSNIIDATVDSLSNKIKTNSDYYTIKEGIFNIILLLLEVQKYISSFEESNSENPLDKEFKALHYILDQAKLKRILKKPPKRSYNLKPLTINKLDYLFRIKIKNQVRDFLDALYEIDMQQSLSCTMKEQELSFPEYVKIKDPLFEVIDCYHPFLESPIKNSYSFKDHRSFCYITGPNMSGKSTFLKTMGVLIYMAHLGFPVPAKKLRLSPFKGLLTSINPSDNIDLGFSHFYSEVKRVKDLALQIESHDNMVLIFDELFRGTNVKDAFDATLMIVKSLARIKSSCFFVSSHILEVAEALINSNDIDFKCFGIEWQGDKILYNYKLDDGVTTERIGMHIIKEEKIELILERIIKRQQ